MAGLAAIRDIEMKLNAQAVIEKLSLTKPLWQTLSDEQISAIQSSCQARFEHDGETCQEWRDNAKALIDIAKMTSQKRRGHIQLWQADIQVPYLMQSAIQFNARSFPEYMKDGKVCQPRNYGKVDQKKVERSQRVVDHINWQCSEQIKEWPENLDKLLLTMPIVGHMFKVKAYDENLGRITDTLCMPDQITIDNSPNNPEWDRRIAVEYPVGQNHCASKKASGQWREVELTNSGPDDNPRYMVVDVYGWYDLDDDGYEEPYTITFDKDTFRLLSIIPRYDVNCLNFAYDPKNPDDASSRELVGIDALNLVTSFQFIPAPDGTALGIGYGQVGKGMIEGMNMFLNQLADAGTLANLGGGFIKKGLFRDDGVMLLGAGEWKITDTQGPGPIGDSVMPLPAPNPSAVTFNLYQEMKGDFAAIAATSEIVSGTDMPAGTPATSVLAIIDQAKMGARAILKRINLAMGREFEIIFRLNQTTLPDELYYTVGDFDQKYIAADDYSCYDYDIVPVADPQYSSRTERLTRSQVAMQLGINSPELIRDTLIDIGYSPDQAERYMQSNQSEAVKAAQMQAQAAEQAERTAKAQKDLVETHIKLLQAQSQSVVDKTVAIKNLADAEAIEAGTQLDIYAAQLAALEREVQQMRGIADEQGEQGGLPAMEGQPGDEGGMGSAPAGDDQSEQLGQSAEPSGMDAGGIGGLPEGAGAGGPELDGFQPDQQGGV